MRPVLTYTRTRNYRRSSSSQVEGAPPLFSRTSSAREPTTRLPGCETTTATSTTLPYWGHDYASSGARPRVPQALPTNHQRPPPDLSERAGCRASQGACAVPSHVLDLAGARATATGRMSTRALSLSHHSESLLCTRPAARLLTATLRCPPCLSSTLLRKKGRRRPKRGSLYDFGLRFD